MVVATLEFSFQFGTLRLELTMLENNWLEHNLYSRLDNPNIDFQIYIKPYSFQEQTFEAASKDVVQKLCELNKKIFVSLSGGMDSEYVMKSFLKSNAYAVPIIVKTEGNLYESSYAFHFCKQNNLQPIVLEKSNIEILKIFNDDIVRKINGVGINSVPALISGRYAQDHNGILIRGEHLIEDDVDWNTDIKGISSNEYDFYNDVLIEKNNTYYFFLHTINIVNAMIKEIQSEETAQEYKFRLYQVPFRPKFSYFYPRLFHEVVKKLLSDRQYKPNYHYDFDKKKFL
jgi:hypothetical protein